MFGPLLSRMLAWVTLLGIVIIFATLHYSLPSSQNIEYTSETGVSLHLNKTLELTSAPNSTSSPQVAATSSTETTQKPGAPATGEKSPHTTPSIAQPVPRPAPSTPTPTPAQTGTDSISTGNTPLTSVIPAPVASLIALPQLNDTVRGATVNILCTSKSSGPLKPLTASGVLIDPRGVILLNAHTAQYFLLQDYPKPGSISCIIRTGNPARPTYQARLLYIPPEWVEENRTGLIQDNPLGTGENDFALLLITGIVAGADLTPLPTLSFSDSDENIDRSVTVPHIIAGYAAGFLDGALVQKDLYLSSSVTLINSIFTFEDNTVDLMSLGGSIVAQKGSSGGPVVSQESQKLVGLIVTTTTADKTGDRDLRAITIAHISRALQKFTGKTLNQFLNQDLGSYADSFTQNVAPTLKQYLVTEIENHR